MKEDDMEGLERWCGEFLAKRGRRPTYFIRTFGCQQNDHDSERAAGILEEAGFSEGPSPQEVDLVLFNTCSVRANADDRFFGHVGALKPLKAVGGPLIGVFGCMMEQDIHRDRLLTTHPYVDFILGAGAMELLPKALNEVLSRENQRRLTRDLTREDYDAFAPDLPVKRERSHRALLTIMTGCNNFCSYCIVPYTRGREKSRDYDQIMEEARRAIGEGAREIMLLGQNVNSYGNDFRLAGKAAPSFASLIAEISQLESLGIVRYMTSHPKDLSDELIYTIGAFPVIEPHIHLPLQSGSDRVLHKMNRRYTSDHYKDLIRRLRQSRPGITVTTDLIVGFPTETEEDFQATLRLMEEVRFDAAFTFLYSPREGTPAAKNFEGDKDPLVQDRFERLLALQNRISLESNRAQVDRTLEVLVDGPSRRDPQIYSGRTRDDRLVNFSLENKFQDPSGREEKIKAIIGRFVPVHITGAGSFSLEGVASFD